MRSLLVATLLLASTAAQAVDFRQPVLDMDGKPIPTCAGTTPDCQKPVTLGTVAALALKVEDPKAPTPPAQKLARGLLALKLYSAGDVALSAEDTTMVKAAIAIAYDSVVVARTYPMLDPASAPK